METDTLDPPGGEALEVSELNFGVLGLLGMLSPLCLSLSLSFLFMPERAYVKHP